MYDAASQLQQVSDPAAEYEFSYDRLGRATHTSILAIGDMLDEIDLTQQFDAAGNRTQLKAHIGDTDDFVNDYVYDVLSRMTRITQHGVSGGQNVTDKRVDFSDRRQSP